MSARERADELPAGVRSWIGERRYEEDGEFEVERGYLLASCASVENGNPLFWDEKVARELTGGWIAPPSMLSVWFRPHHWAPGRSRPRQPLQVHFDLKQALGLPEAIMTDNEIVFGEPVRPGDRLRTWQVLRSVSEEKGTRLGRGRFWVIDVEYVNQRGESVGRESYTGFGYRKQGESYPRSEQGVASAKRAQHTLRVPAFARLRLAARRLRRLATPKARKAVLAASGLDREVPGHEGAEAQVEASSTAAQRGAAERSNLPGLTLPEVRVGQALTPLSVEVSATTVVLGALATRDWRPMHHDREFAQQRNGVRDIFLNTPNQAAWFERYLTDWSGPRGRLARLRFRMRDPVFAGDRMELSGVVEKVERDARGCGFVELALRLVAGARLATECQARVALPVDPTDNPWRRRGEEWSP